jgi:hypothetical protein
VRAEGTADTVVVAVDRNGDSDFADAGERIELDSGVTDAEVDVAVDAGDHVAVAYRVDRSGTEEVWLAHDRNADGDFADAAEQVQVFTGNAGCVATALDNSGRAAVLFQAVGSDGVTLLHDLSGDGDFDDAGESQDFGVGSANACAMTTAPTGLALIHDAWLSTSRLLVDLDGDDTFNGPGENVSALPKSANAVGITADATGQLYLVSGSQFLEVGP